MKEGAPVFLLTSSVPDLELDSKASGGGDDLSSILHSYRCLRILGELVLSVLQQDVGLSHCC